MSQASPRAAVLRAAEASVVEHRDQLEAELARMRAILPRHERAMWERLHFGLLVGLSRTTMAANLRRNAERGR